VNQLDALLLILLIPFTLRGWWRGFCRETFALAGLVGGALAAAALAPQVAAALVERGIARPAMALPLAWAGVFVAAWFAAGVLGLIADRMARALFLGGVNSAAGAVFGSVKGAALLGFGLLLAQYVAASPKLDRVIASSRLGRPLEQMAGSVVATGRQLGGALPERRA